MLHPNNACRKHFILSFYQRKKSSILRQSVTCKRSAAVVKKLTNNEHLIDYDNLPIPMTSVDVITRMLKVKVALRNFGLLAILYRRRADCVHTSSVFC